MKTLTFSFLCLAAAGCQHQVRLTDTETVNWPPPPVCKRVMAGETLAGLHDQASWGVDHVSFPTGQMARRIFTGRNTTCRIDLLSSKLSIEARDEFPFPIIQTIAHYRLACVLLHDGQRIPLSVSTTEQSGVNGNKAIADAIGTALHDLAQQTAVLIQ